MKLSEIKEILAQRGLVLTKSLGQNFMHDSNQVRRMIQCASLAPGDPVLEIGPGLGPLTEYLLAAGCPVLAIEKDLRLCDCLQERLGGQAGLEIIHADALDYLKAQSRPWRDWTLVSNLPYSVGSRLLMELALGPEPPKKLVATLQLEVIQRLVARPGTAAYGALTLLLGLRYQPGSWFKIPASCFHPEPEVDSGCVVLERRASPLLTTAQQLDYDRIVRRSFSQRRKMMLKLLKTDWPAAALEAAFAGAGLSLQCRAEDASFEQYLNLTRLLGGSATHE